MKLYYVYIFECADGTYYTGVTNDMERRYMEHSTGLSISSYTYSRRPVKLVWYAETNLVYYAIEKEKQIKKWSKAKKAALINSDWDKLVKLSRKNFILRKMIMPEE
jgi:putative endonuclease